MAGKGWAGGCLVGAPPPPPIPPPPIQARTSHLRVSFSTGSSNTGAAASCAMTRLPSGTVPIK
jgi:hypothetical protein